MSVPKNKPVWNHNICDLMQIGFFKSNVVFLRVILLVHTAVLYSSSMRDSVMLYEMPQAVSLLCCGQTLDNYHYKCVVIMSTLASTPTAFLLEFLSILATVQLLDRGVCMPSVLLYDAKLFSRVAYHCSLPPEVNESAIVLQLCQHLILSGSGFCQSVLMTWYLWF